MNRNHVSGAPRKALVLSLVCALCALPALPAFSETITLRSGGAPAGSFDPALTFKAGLSLSPLSPAPFTAADFAAALSGPPATDIAPHVSWLPTLACDPLAQWVGVGAFLQAYSTLFAREFDVTTCCIEKATLTFCWAADDRLGDLIHQPNPAGVYLNEIAVSPIIEGGGFAVETAMGPIDVTSLVHCGQNSLHIYDRDTAAFASGVIFSATLEITACTVPARPATWSRIKALYRN